MLSLSEDDQSDVIEAFNSISLSTLQAYHFLFLIS